MKLVLPVLVVIGALIWFRSGRRWSSSGRGNLISLFVLMFLLGGIVALIFLAKEMF